MGSFERPVSGTRFALGARGRFVARSADSTQKHLPQVLARAPAFEGASFVEIFQNRIVYNDGAFADVTNRDTASEHQILVEHGRPLLFGENRQKGLRLNPKKLRLEVVTLGEGGTTEDDIAVHDETNRSLAELLAGMERPDFPVAFGVLYCNPFPSFESDVDRLTERALAEKGTEDLNALLRQGHTWTVEG